MKTNPATLLTHTYRIIELDGVDVILGQSNAPILGMDEQDSLREEDDLSYNFNLNKQ